MTSTPETEPDARLLAAHDLALAALHEITSERSVGPAAGYTLEPDGVVSLRFENRLGGYPGWYWTVSLARVAEEEPTVLEVELLPGEGALLAPEWVPWATRLAEYHAQQTALAEAAAAAGEELDEGADDDDDDDDDQDSLLHAGDVDGVDIDEYDDADEYDDEDADDEDDLDESDPSDDEDDDLDDDGDADPEDDAADDER
jgi:hypothetical protein